MVARVSRTWSSSRRCRAASVSAVTFTTALQNMLCALRGYRRSRNAGVGVGAFAQNPNLCSRCCERLPPGGAEIDVAVFFADVRSYTGFVEKPSPTRLAATMKRFYQAAIESVIQHDGLVDKL